MQHVRRLVRQLVLMERRMWPLLPRRPPLQMFDFSLAPCSAPLRVLLRHLDDAEVLAVVLLRQHLQVEGGDDGVRAAQETEGVRFGGQVDKWNPLTRHRWLFLVL